MTKATNSWPIVSTENGTHDDMSDVTVDFATQERTPKKNSKYYQGAIAENAVPLA